MENNEKKIEKIVTIFDYARMCKSLSCCECPLSLAHNGYGNPCNGFLLDFTEEANDMILTWLKEEEKKNKVKTYADDFFEHLPNAMKHEGEKHPEACRQDIYGGKCNYGSCKTCWNQPYEESEDEE